MAYANGQDKQMCFGCQHSHNMGCPNLDSTICVDDCRRGSKFTPFNGDSKATALKKEGMELDKLVKFVEGIGFCFGESDPVICRDCPSLTECQELLIDELSLNPKTQGSSIHVDGKVLTAEDFGYVENGRWTPDPEETVFKGFQHKSQFMEPEDNAHGDLGGPIEKRESYIDRTCEEVDQAMSECKGPENVCDECPHKIMAQAIIDQDIKRAMLSVSPITILQPGEIVTGMPPKQPLRFNSDSSENKCGEPYLKSGATKEDDGNMRTFESGATRDTGTGKLEYVGFLSLSALEQYAKYMNMNRLQSDGQIRASDNWKKGFPPESYVESNMRHALEWIKYHQSVNRTKEMNNAGIAAVCGVIFNAMGYLNEWLKDADMVDFDGDDPTKEMKERRDAIEKLSETEGS